MTVFGWRCWGLTTAPGELSSFLNPGPDITWPPGWLRAECMFHPHAAPDDGPDCSRCGWRAQPGLGELADWLNQKPATPHCIGRVELDGRILRGDRAHPEIPDVMRGELARVAGPLVIAPRWGLDSHAGPLAARYGVQVVMSSAATPLRWPRTAAADLAALAARR